MDQFHLGQYNFNYDQANDAFKQFEVIFGISPDNLINQINSN